MSDDLDDYTKMYITLKGDICFLKLTLKECREWIEYLEDIMLEKENIDGADYFQRLLTKIDNAIGENN